MESPEQNRQDRRYSIGDYLQKEYHNLHVEVLLDPPIRAEVSDISMNGLGFEIPGVEADVQERLEGADKFHMKIHVAESTILIEAKKTWGAMLSGKDGNIFKGGVMFAMVSPEDRIVLLNFLDKIRKGSDGA